MYDLEYKKILDYILHLYTYTLKLIFFKKS